MLQALAVMEERQGNKEAAMALLERALKQDPLDAPSWQASFHDASCALNRPPLLHTDWDCIAP